MQEVLPGVFLLESNGRKGFGYQHFVRRDAGNLLIDLGRLGLLTDAYDALEAAGGVKAILTGDKHFAGQKTDDVRARFGSTVYVSAIEGEGLRARGAADVQLPMARTMIEGDILAIPTPGHTPGQLSFLVPVAGKACLFTGDFVYRAHGAWRPGNLSRRKMKASFEGLRDLAVDYIVPWTDYDETEFFVPVEGRLGALVDEMIAACTKP